MTTEDNWLVNYVERPGASMHLFCLPYAGGSAAIYRDWGELLHPSIELWAIELPGHGLRWAEPAIPNIVQLSDLIVDRLHRKIDRPFAIFGHSMGGFIAFEISRKLDENCERDLQRLFVSGSSPPGFREDREHLRDLSDEEFISSIRVLNGTPAEVLKDNELMDLMLPLLRTDFRACDEYRSLDATMAKCPISAYGGLSDPRVCRDDLSGWKQCTSNRVTIKMFEGDHFFLRTSRDRVIYNVGLDLLSRAD